MSSDWSVCTLGEFVRLRRGHDLTSSEQKSGPFPVMGSAGQNGTHNDALATGPGVVIGRSGASVGRVHFTEVDYWPHNTCLYVTDFLGNNPKYAYYLLQTLDLAAYNSGSAQPSLNRNLIYTVRLQVPTRPEQNVIADFLSNLDDRITLLRETNKTLESIAQAVFKSWFVDFDAVRAKMETRQPEGMDEETAALFPDSFEESVLGAIPRGWQVMSIGDAVETVGGATPDTKNSDFWVPQVHCWTTPKDLSGIAAPILLDTERKLSAEGIKRVSSGLLPTGTLLLSSRAPIGYLAIAQVPLAINQGYIAMLPGGLLSPLYLFFWCRQNMENIKSRANGSTFMEISKRAFRPIPVLVPSPELIHRFADTANALFKRLSENEKQAQTLSTLRDTLLPSLISGRLRLPEAQV
jgi:type I restriction enzyme S subunit